MLASKSLQHHRCASHLIMRQTRGEAMFKRVMLGLFAMIVVTILGTAEHAQAGCGYWTLIGGSFTCLLYTPGSLIVDAQTTCDPDVGPCDVTGPLKLAESIYGNVEAVPGWNGKPCEVNATCGIAGTLKCDGVTVTPDPITLTPSMVNLPLTGNGDGNCNGNPPQCDIIIEIDVKKCAGAAANCCPNCCPAKSQSASFTPSDFDSLAAFSRPNGQSGAQALTIKDENCTPSAEGGSCGARGRNYPARY